MSLGRGEGNKELYEMKHYNEYLIKETVRTLRRNSTSSEKLLWQAVRNRNLKGVKFFRQHPIRFEIDGYKRFFVADFYCPEYKLVVELDGNIHERQKDYDMMRTHIMNIMGITVVRFKNEEIEFNLEKVLSELKEYIE